MNFRAPASERDRAFDWSLWAAAACPLWALVVFSWVFLGQLRSEVQEVARYYGVYVGKEALRAALARVASAMELAKRQGKVGRTEGAFSEDACGAVSRLSGLQRFLLILDPDSLNPLCLGDSGPGTAASALGDPGFRETFLRTVRQMNRQQATEGLFSRGARSGGAGKDQKWFVLLQPAGCDVLCTLLVPESEIDRAGGSLEEALSVLLEKRQRRYLFLSAAYCIALSAVIALLVKKGRPQWASTKPGGTHDGHPKTPNPLGRPG